MADPVTARREEQTRLLSLARGYVEELAERLPLVAAAVAGSVARGDFNAWSDVDVVVVAEELPGRIPDRGALLAARAPGRVQPVGFTPAELAEALRRGNPLAREAVESGVVVAGEEFFAGLRQEPRPIHSSPPS